MNFKHDLTCEGVIDEPYTGSIQVKLYNNGGYDYEVKAGDKIAQLVVVPVLYVTPEQVDELTPTERGNGGFGSTGY